MKLPHSIDLQSYTEAAKDAYGNKVKTYANYATAVRAYVQPASVTNQMRERYGVEDGTIYRVFIKPRSDIAEGQRMVYSTDTYDILEVHSWGNNTEFWCVPLRGV